MNKKEPVKAAFGRRVLAFPIDGFICLLCTILLPIHKVDG